MTPALSSSTDTPVRMDPDHGSRVYIVEDDAAVSDSLVQLLRMRGYETAVFPSGELFLAAANAQSAGCAILDIRLPGMSGLDLQAEMVKRGIKLPVIVVTGHGDTQSSPGVTFRPDHWGHSRSTSHKWGEWLLPLKNRSIRIPCWMRWNRR